MNKRLANKIDKFIKDKRKSDSGYAEVKKGDLRELGTIINELIKAKYEADCDGDYPINFTLINRHIHEPCFDLKIPYSHKDLEGHFKAVSSNLSYYTEKLDRLCRHGNIEIKRKEEK